MTTWAVHWKRIPQVRKFYCLSNRTVSGCQPGHGPILAEQGQLLTGLEIVEGRGAELPEPFGVIADHFNDHAQRLPEGPTLGTL
jgi:hypothetical protein